MELKIGKLSAKSGEKAMGMVEVPGTLLKIPITLIVGEKEGEFVQRSNNGK